MTEILTTETAEISSNSSLPQETPIGISTNAPAQQERGKPLERDEFESLRGVVYFVSVILALGFITFIIQQFISSATAFNNLTNQINQQNTEIQILSSKVDSLTQKKLK